jgi:hypothetical protein
MSLQDQLPDNACSEARLWLGRRRSAPKAWKECRRGDWMLWLLARRGADRKQLVMAACECARLSLHHVPAGEDRPRKAIETAEAWCRGEASLEEVRAAADAAYAAAAAAYAAAAAAAADAAAADAAADAADAAADARMGILQQCADIVRKYFPDSSQIGRTS